MLRTEQKLQKLCFAGKAEEKEKEKKKEDEEKRTIEVAISISRWWPSFSFSIGSSRFWWGTEAGYVELLPGIHCENLLHLLVEFRSRFRAMTVDLNNPEKERLRISKNRNNKCARKFWEENGIVGWKKKFVLSNLF